MARIKDVDDKPFPVVDGAPAVLQDLLHDPFPVPARVSYRHLGIGPESGLRGRSRLLTFGRNPSIMFSASAASETLRPIVVCADDYGLAPGVSDAIAGLIRSGRLSATSCMSLCADWRRAAEPLRESISLAPADIGLHLTLTDHPALTRATGLGSSGRLPPLARLLPRALAHRLPAAAVADEVRAQFDAFEDAWGTPPDHVDGHQHVHLLPGIREALVAELLRRYPVGRVWVRDCVEPPVRCLWRGEAVGKALFIGALGFALRRQLRAAGIPANAGFSGLHDFSAVPPIGDKMRRFLAGVGPRPLVHVHPGRVDAALIACDTLTTPREAELAYLASDQFARDLAAAGLRPARFAAFAPP